jgi:hypothetical protein
MLVCYLFKLKYLNKKKNLSYIEKNITFFLVNIKGFKSHIKKIFLFCEHRVYILNDFKSHIEKIKHSSIYIVNFKKG